MSSLLNKLAFDGAYQVFYAGFNEEGVVVKDDYYYAVSATMCRYFQDMNGHFPSASDVAEWIDDLFSQTQHRILYYKVYMVKNNQNHIIWVADWIPQVGESVDAK